MNSVKLSTAIRVVDRDIDTLELREPVGRDLIGLPDAQTDQLGWSILLAVKLVTNAPEQAVLNLPLNDTMALVREVATGIRPLMQPNSSNDTSRLPDGGAPPNSSLG